MDLSLLRNHPTRAELLPAALDRKAREHPNRAWAATPKDPDDLTKGVKELSFSLLANAYNRAAWQLEEDIGKASKGKFPTVAYLGPPDLRYFFITIALVKLGYKVLLLQATLSVEGKLNLLEKTDCNTFLYGDDRGIIENVLHRRHMKAVEVPPIDVLMDTAPVKPYPYYRPLEEGLFDPILIIHTSGSTGLPKPVVLNQGFHAANNFSHDIADIDGNACIWKRAAESKRFYLGFPIAHAGGVHAALAFSAYNHTTLVLVEKGNLSGATLEALIDYAGVGGCLVMPKACIELAQKPSGLAKAGKLKMLSCSGGHLPLETGKALAQATNLVSSWGTTETGSMNLHVPDPEDWEYNYFNPDYNHFRFEHVGSGLHEIIAVPHPDPYLRHWQKLFWIRSDLGEYPLGDLWSKHPSKPNHWRYEGRADDMIVLDSGHNFHPMFYTTEILLKDPNIKSAIILGQSRPSLAVIVETADGTCGQETIDALWETVKEVNERSNAQAQIPKCNIIVANAEKPLPNAAKGNVVRKQAEKLYAKELDQIYGRSQ